VDPENVPITKIKKVNENMNEKKIGRSHKCEIAAKCETRFEPIGLV
jgi:hypothetical protein